MAYSVQLSPHTVRQYKKLNPPIQQDVQRGIDTLQYSPQSGPKIKRLKGRLHEYFRLRIGDYRVVYTVASRDHVVYIDYLQHRKDIYRDID